MNEISIVARFASHPQASRHMSAGNIPSATRLSASSIIFAMLVAGAAHLHRCTWHTTEQRRRHRSRCVSCYRRPSQSEQPYLRLCCRGQT